MLPATLLRPYSASFRSYALDGIRAWTRARSPVEFRVFTNIRRSQSSPIRGGLSVTLLPLDVRATRSDDDDQRSSIMSIGRSTRIRNKLDVCLADILHAEVLEHVRSGGREFFPFNGDFHGRMKEPIGIRLLCRAREQLRVVTHSRIHTRSLARKPDTLPRHRWNRRPVVEHEIRRSGESRLAVICYRNTAMVFA